MNFKKRANGSWADTPNYIHKTDTDTITTLPAVLYPNDTTATVGLKGQTAQSSVPSPTSPVMPEGTGERTGNLAPPLTEWVDGYVSGSGAIAPPSENYKEKSSDYIPVKVGREYTFSVGNEFPGGTYYPWRAIGWYTKDKTFISRASGIAGGALSTSAPSNAVYCRLSYRTYGETTNPMLNLGSTPLPYEPYGYKIPISSANTTTPVYLGEVETTRKVKKLVLTGEEALTYSSQDDNRYVCSLTYSTLNMSDVIGICSHFVWKSNYNPTVYNRIVRANNKTFYLSLANDLLDEVSINGFKAYLAAQYSAGTPVTIWYVLATPETGIVNEPLRKIGDYADEVSGITIPTIAGANTLSVGTTLQPSEVTVNYKGWHPVADVHEADNGAWT